MIPRACRRLVEVDFPIAEVSKHAAREKSIRHGHPSTLHLWWARRPLASSRAVLLALLLPDPCDPLCPDDFKRKGRAIVGELREPPVSDEELRKALLWFIGAFSNWDRAANLTYLRVARNLVKAAQAEEVPLVVDPFAGGGSIPLEALRLGCEAFASDLNPVACLILKVMLEDVPRHGPGLADELRRVGGDIRRQAERELIMTVRRRLPICGPGRCGARRRTVVRRSRCCGRFGCVGSRNASARCAIEWNAGKPNLRRWNSRCLGPWRTVRSPTEQWLGPGRHACAAAPCCRPNGCVLRSRRSGAALTWCSTRRGTVPEGRA